MTDTVHVTRSAGQAAANVSALSIEELTTLIGNSLPTADPLVAGALWNNSGVLTVSEGP